MTEPKLLSSYDIEDLGGISIAQIQTVPAQSSRFHLLLEKIEIACPKCHAVKYTVGRWLAYQTCCDPCRIKGIEDAMLAKCAAYWEKICPKLFRATDIAHPEFPIDLYRRERHYTGTESLFLCGRSGVGKSRVGAQLLKRALVAGRSVAFLWPEELKAHAKSFNDRLKLLRHYSSHDVLMMDDALLTGAQDEKIADFVKDLIDMMQRDQKHMIITSQIGGSEYLEQADKYGNMTTADRERIAALLRRIKERFRVVPFVIAAKTESMF